MSHKTIDPEDIKKVEMELARISKAIDRVRIYSQAKDNESVKLALQEVKRVRSAIIYQKNSALDHCTRDGEKGALHDKATLYRGYEMGLDFLVNSFENTEEEIKAYHAERKRLESLLSKYRKMLPRDGGRSA